MLLAALCAGFAKLPADELERRFFESILNTATRDFFSGTLKLEHAHIGRDFRLQLAGIRGELVTRERPVTVEAALLESEDPLYYLLLLKPVHLRFSGLKPSGASTPGVSGKAVIAGNWKWTFELTAAVEGLGLDEIVWINPDSLAGSSGVVTGDLTIKADFTGHSEFSIHLKVTEPGGNLQARFFDAVMPYLPQKKNAQKLQDLSKLHELVHYNQASLDASLEGDDQVKMLLHILIPDYNLNLNLNILIHVDEKNAFLKLFQLMGVLQSYAQPPK